MIVGGTEAMAQPESRTVLFLCTGNYFRSRFAEILFNSLSTQRGLDWTASSRGLAIERGAKWVFAGETSTGRMKRRFEELVEYLGRDNLFPEGVFLLTGTGIVPPDDFTLQPGDMVSIEVPGIGVLRNPVTRG